MPKIFSANYDKNKGWEMRLFIKVQTKGVDILAGYNSSITASGRKGLAQTLRAMLNSSQRPLQSHRSGCIVKV